jgi:threonine dehydrogenase-like Zn-dependent dehydrogenase
VRALVVERQVHRFAAARLGAAVGGTGAALGLGPLRLVETDAPRPPHPSWRRIRPRLAGICGSDLHTVDGASSRYFEPIVSFPFVLGHEIVADVLEGPLAGRRAVVEPVLGCAARAIDPPCRACAEGRKGACERIAFGEIAPGLQTGFCRDTGGGWSEELIAHDSQLHAIPDELADEDAVMVEPTACALHAALAAGVIPGETVVVLGSGTIGLAALAALRAHGLPGTLIAVAKHPVQREFATELGADTVVRPSELARAVRRSTGTLALERRSGGIERLAGGADVVLDCVGTGASLSEALAVVRPGGRVVLAGMPATVKVDLAPLWQREITLLGAYAYGRESVGADEEGSGRTTFALATELVAAASLGRLVSARYALDHFEEALRHAGGAGRRGAVKVVFDLRPAARAWRAPARDAAVAHTVARAEEAPDQESAGGHAAGPQEMEETR